MEFIIDNEWFYKAISDVNKAVSLKTPFPILSGIKVIAYNDSLVLIGSNSDIVIEKVIPLTVDGVKVLEVHKTGSVVIPAKHLSEIIKKLPAKVHVRVNEKQVVTIQSEEIVTKIFGFNSEQYPKLPLIDETNYAKIPCTELIEIIKQTAFAVSKSESRPVLTGVNISFKDHYLSFAATDSHRLALRELVLESSINGSFIVPSASLNELTKLIHNDNGEIRIYVTSSYMAFKTSSFTLFSRLIEGNYPNITGLLPKNAKTTIILDTAQLLTGIDRACLFASEWKNNNVQLEIVDGKKIKISSNSSNIGEIEETQNIKMINGETDLTISLDGSYLINALKAIKEEEIRLSFGDTMRPVLIEPINNPSYIHLISPVRSY
ncbi:DNA polymerase III subunit beta [Lysinibacillus odysseyi]|uniref:Beta sliding clamp n=1 Tax=Lysinibacillus odysseyi 34hs-1 = NBRC 100172 TaxID=1220589 RepID=A0A0A3JBD3_9BACI|nr:DNA polymerase III subunit beta [Lysinibacillus odysseyi]KGR84317.1 DNA polymerase III subunit beta [Lysinibacillus odysseyi 34hs-1 = NBRC 100172]